MTIPRQGMNKEGAVGTISQPRQPDDEAHLPRWGRLERAERFDQSLARQAQGLSQRQAAQKRDVPRSPLQAWGAFFLKRHRQACFSSPLSSPVWSAVFSSSNEFQRG